MNLQQLADALTALEARLAKLEAIAYGPYRTADDQPPHKPSPDATGQPGRRAAGQTGSPADDQPPHK